MNKPLRLMCVVAHPDDESLGMGGTLAKYAAEGIETFLVTATRGERGWFGNEKENPGLEALGKMRESELLNAARELSIGEVKFLDYMDGDLDQANVAEVVAKIVSHLRCIRPQVVITFDPNGTYGHPDHIAICQFTTAAVLAAADPSYRTSAPPHSVAKLYYMAWPKGKLDAYESVFGNLGMHIDGVVRRTIPWPDWAISTIIDTAQYWQTVWQAVACHRTQLPAYSHLKDLSPEYHKTLWGTQEYYRVLSLVNGGRAREADLFEGLR
jgi:Uncharacterized proteins, LmbE homologs